MADSIFFQNNNYFMFQTSLSSICLIKNVKWLTKKQLIKKREDFRLALSKAANRNLYDFPCDNLQFPIVFFYF